MENPVFKGVHTVAGVATLLGRGPRNRAELKNDVEELVWGWKFRERGGVEKRASAWTIVELVKRRVSIAVVD